MIPNELIKENRKKLWQSVGKDVVSCNELPKKNTTIKTPHLRWGGFHHNSGYAQRTFYLDGKRYTELIHKLIYILTYEEYSPPGYKYLHTCGEAWCINPSHIRCECNDNNDAVKKDKRDSAGHRIFSPYDNKTWKMTFYSASIIRTLYCGFAIPIRDIAKSVHLSIDGVSNIINGIAWQDLGYEPIVDPEWKRWWIQKTIHAFSALGLKQKDLSMLYEISQGRVSQLLNR